MKQKIFVLTLCFTFLMNSLSFADKKDIKTIQIDNYIQSRSIYNPQTNETEIILSDVNNKSATVAVTTTVASTLLAIATKAGISFADAGSMDKFLYHFLSLDNATEIVGAIKGLLEKTTNGIITLSRSLIDTITRGMSKSYYNRLDKIQLGGVTIPVVGEGSLVNNIEDKVSHTLLKQSVIQAPSNVSVSGEVGKTFDELQITSPNVVTTIKKSSSYSYEILFPSSYKDGPSAGYGIGLTKSPHSGSDFWKATILAYYVPAVGKHYLYGSVLSWDEKETNINNYKVSTVRLSTGGSINYLTYEDCTDLVIDAPSIPSFPDAWSETINGDDGTTSSNITIPVPSNPNQLIGQDSSTVDPSKPGYDVWTPGTTVAPPSTDTPDVDYGEGDTTVPEDKPEETPEETPDSGGTTWDWLKNLIQAIVGLLTNIWEWITSFWDMLTNILSNALSGIVEVLSNIWSWIKEFWQVFTKTLGDILSSVFSKLFDFIGSFWETLSDFIISLFVPSDSYWTDKVTEMTGEIKNKFPTINIEKLEQLAVGEKKFEDIYATFFGQKCLVVRASLVNDVIGWARPIIQGLICIFLLLFNYNQLYKILRNGSLTSPSESSHKK